MGRNHPAFADSPREHASVHIQESLLDDLDGLVDRSPGSNDSRSQQFRSASEAWVRCHETIESVGLDLSDDEAVALIEDAVSVYLSREEQQ